MGDRNLNLAIAVVVAACIFTLAACTKDGISSGKKAESSGVSDSGAMVGNMYRTGLPIVKNKVNYSLVASKDPKNVDFNDLPFFKKMEERTNIRIDFQSIPSSSYNEKKNLLLASGDLPDGFMKVNTDDIATYGSNVFIPLDGLIDQYGVNLKKVIAEHPDVKKAITAPDGKIYSLLQISNNGTQAVPWQMFINKAWLDKFGLKVPENLNDLHNALQAFKSKDPNENGKADEIPFTFRMDGNEYLGAGLYGSFGIPDIPDHFAVINGKVVYTPVTEQYRDAVSYFSKWVKEGLMDIEGFTQDQKQLFAKGNAPNPIVGAGISWFKANVSGVQREKDYVTLPPQTGPKGDKAYGWRWKRSDGMSPNSFLITTKAKNPEILMRWADFCYDKEVSIEFAYGPLGTSVDKDNSGKYVFNDPPSGTSFDEWRYKLCPVNGMYALFPEDYNTILSRPAQEQDKYDDIEKYYRKYLSVEGMPNLIFNKKETEVKSAKGSDIQKYALQTHVRWLNEGNIDKEWDNYVQSMKKMGVDELIQAYQEAYDRFNAVK